MEKWYVEVKKADFDAIAKRFHISPVVARLLCNRGMTKEEEICQFLNGTREDMYSPFKMADMDAAVELMAEYIKERKRIRIIGDYDIDGVCAAYILQKGLACAMRRIQGKDAGGKRKLPPLLDVVIPHRVKDGYGLGTPLVMQAAEEGVDVIITCDNGIAASRTIFLAKERGIHVIVTDHHEVPYKETATGEKEFVLPPADAVVDPHREDCRYPYKGICGATVAYKFIQGLLMLLRLGKKGIKQEEEEKLLEECFAFAAFATVGDVMELTGENHIIVKYGLKSIANCENRGMRALIEQCGLKDKELTPYHIGFVLGPCFNASGRLDSADRVMELLNATSKRAAMEIASELREINARRQELTAQGVEEAIKEVERARLDRRSVIVVYLPEVHESITGIIAGRLRERYGKPVFVLADGEGCIKGSGRSIEGYHMFHEMTKIKDTFINFGGHKMAAGLSLPPALGCVNAFSKKINMVCELGKEDFIQRVMIDVPMPIDYVSSELIEQMKLLEPYGTGNQRPLFAQKDVIFRNGRVLGKSRNVVRGKIKSRGGAVMDAVYFGDGETFMRHIEACRGMVDIVYTPVENVYRGVRMIQIEIKHIKFGYEEGME